MMSCGPSSTSCSKNKTCGRQQSERAAGRADGCGALSQSSLRPAGDRLAARNREARSRRCARLLPALLHAQQRDPGDRRRRHRRGNQNARGSHLRQGRRCVADDRAARVRPQEPPQEAPRTVTLADPQVEQPSINRDYLAPSRTTAKPGESEALEVLAHRSAAAPTAGSIARSCSTKASRSNAGAYYSSTALDSRQVRRLRLAEAGHHPARRSKRPSTAC